MRMHVASECLHTVTKGREKNNAERKNENENENKNGKGQTNRMK